MSQDTANTTLFFERGASFEDVLMDGALGGPKAVSRYLETRRKMCVRAIIGSATDGSNPALLQHGIRAIDEAQAVLPKLTRRSASKAMLMTLGPRHLLGLK